MASLLTHSDPIAQHQQRYEALQAALDLIDQGITLMDSDLKMVAWNRRFLELLEFPTEMAYIGAPFESFIRYNALRGEYGPGDPEEQIAMRVGAARVLTVHDIERTRPNGTVLSVRGVPVPQHGFITLYSDITKQRRNEARIREQNVELEARVQQRTQELLDTNGRLRIALDQNEAIAQSLIRSETRIRLITDSIPALVGYFGNDRRYHYVNRGYGEWFDLDTTNPSSINARHFLGTETYMSIRPHVMQAIQGKPVTFEYEVQTKHLGRRVAKTSLIPELTPDGRFAGCFELTFDVTDERMAQTRMASAQKMEALGQLTGGMAHDFNNILTVIQGNLTALSNKPELKDYLAEYLQPALEATVRGSDLLRGLLAFSRKHPLKSQIEDLNECIRMTVKWLRSTLPDTLNLTVSIPEVPMHVRLDSNQFRDALLNLALNARDATEGKGQLSIECVAIELGQPGAAAMRLPAARYARIRVRDDGCGMDQATLNRVFEPFFSTKPSGKGTGLGMPMVYGFVQQSGGAIDLLSSPDEGTTVTIYLPISHQNDAELTTKHDCVDTTNCNDEWPQKLALLVEDDQSVRQWLRRELLDLGYSVVEAANGDEALALIDNTPSIQLLLSDVVMPGETDGVQLAQYARRMSDIPKIVLMSGFMSDRQVPAGIPLLNKPFTTSDLVTVLTEKNEQSI